MTEEQERADRNMADSYPCNDQRARAWAEIDAERAAHAKTLDVLAEIAQRAGTGIYDSMVGLDPFTDIYDLAAANLKENGR